MAFGKIPRFSPSFSPTEALISARFLLQDGPREEVIDKFEAQFRDYIGARHAVMVPSARYGFYLPSGPVLTDDQLDRVADAVKDVLR